MSVAVYKNEKEKADPMAKALQMLQIGATASSFAGSGKPAGSTDLTSNDVADPQATAPTPVSGTNNKSTAMSRKYRSYTA